MSFQAFERAQIDQLVSNISEWIKKREAMEGGARPQLFRGGSTGVWCQVCPSGSQEIKLCQGAKYLY